jgi:hypothetical protein
MCIKHKTTILEGMELSQNFPYTNLQTYVV